MENKIIKKIKVLMIAPIVFPISNQLKYAGTERVIAGLSDKFSNDEGLGIDVIVGATGDSDIENVDFIFVYSSSLWVLDEFERKIIDSKEALEKHFSFCIDYAIKHNVDIIHDHAGLINSLEYNKRKDELNIPIIMTIHNDIDEKNLQKYAVWRRLQIEKRPVFFIAISKSQKKKFEEMIGIKIFDYIYNGVPDVYPFIGKDGKQDYLFWIGRISPKKGTDLAIKLAKAVKRPLVIAGEVHTPDKEFYEKEIRPSITRLIGGKNKKEREDNKKDFIKKLEKNERLINKDDIFYIGPVDDQEKGVLNSRAYALIMLNRWEEPFGLVIPEAMITGTPVIGTELGAIPEIIINKKTGFLLPVEWIDEESLSLKEDTLLDGAKKILKDVKKINPSDCLNHVKENFNLDKMARGYADLYAKILENGKIKNKT